MQRNKISQVRAGSREARELYLSLVSPKGTDLAPVNALITQQSTRSDRPELKKFFDREVQQQFGRMAEQNKKLFSAKLKRQELDSRDEQARDEILRKSQMRLEHSQSKRDSKMKDLQKKWQGHRMHLQEMSTSFRKSSKDLEEKSFRQMRESERDFINYLQEKRKQAVSRSRELAVKKVAERQSFDQSQRAREGRARQQHEQLMTRVLVQTKAAAQFRPKNFSFSISHEEKKKHCLDFRTLEENTKQRESLNQYMNRMDREGRQPKAKGALAVPVKEERKKVRRESACTKDHFRVVQRKGHSLQIEQQSHASKLAMVREMKRRQLEERVQRGEQEAEWNLHRKRREQAEVQLRERVRDMRLRAQFRFMNVLKG